MKRALLFIHAISGIHNGSGIGRLDLDRPIVRERTTNLPFVQAESIKGKLRSTASTVLGLESKTIRAVFGNEPKGNTSGNPTAGSVSPDDAFLLAFPVPCIYGGFVWLLTPLSLARLYRSWALLGDSTNQSILQDCIGQNLTAGELLIPCNSLTHMSENESEQGDVTPRRGNVLISDLRFHATESQELTALTTTLADYIWPNPSEKFWNDHFRTYSAMVDLDTFVRFTELYTEVRANIRIYQTGEHAGTTVIRSLRYTEYLPEESVLVSLVETKTPPAQLTETIQDFSHPMDYVIQIVRNSERFQIGGDVNDGKGFVGLTILHEQGGWALTASGEKAS